MKILKFTGLCLASLFLGVNSVSGQNNSESLENDLDYIRGLVKPVKTATLSSGIMGRITQIPYRMGDSFAKGDILVKFDCSLYEAELKAAQAELKGESRKFENNNELLKLNATSQVEVDISESNFHKAEAELQMANVRVERCTIRAPYHGRVVDIKVNEFESVTPDQLLLTILSDRQLEIELIVPSTWLNWLKKGVGFRFTVDETGQTYDAKVAQLGASVDPVSQTIRVKGIFADETEQVLSGMSGTARFDNVH